MSARIGCPVTEYAGQGHDHPALISQDRTYSYPELDHAIHCAFEKLKLLGVKSGERVALISPNTVEYIIALFALWRMGAIACLLSTRLPQEAIKAALKTLACTRTIVPGEISIPGTRTMKQVRVPGIKYALNDPADIMFTSGSSGEPKAARHSFGNHYYNAQAANEHILLSPGDRWLLSLPLYHVGGLGILWRTFLAGATVVVPEVKEDIAESLRKYKITHVSLVPTQLHRLLSNDQNIAVLEKMKAILVGGSAIPDALLRKAMDARLPLYVSYGLTEMASQVATSECLSKENPLPHAQILKNAQLKISAEHEILVRGKTLFQGYVNGEDVVLPLDKNGWFHTGDLGCLHNDGTMTVLGRKDNMFISGGENIQPEEIERHLCRIEGVAQAVVVPVKSEEFGARPVAFVEFKDGTQLSKNEILSSLREYLPSFKLPDGIYCWPDSGSRSGMKINRAYFRRLVENPRRPRAIV